MRCPTKGSQCLRSKKLFIHCIYIAMQATELPIALLGKSTKGWCSLNCTKSAPSRSWEMIFYPMLFFGFCMVLDILVASLCSQEMYGYIMICHEAQLQSAHCWFLSILRWLIPNLEKWRAATWFLSNHHLRPFDSGSASWSIPDLAYSRIDLGTFTFHRRWGCTNSLWCRFGRKKNMQTNLKFPGTRR